MINVVSIGGYGHSFLVFNEMLGLENVKLLGLAPAFENEDLSFFSGHELCKNVNVFADYKKMIAEVKPDIVLVSTRLDRIADIIIYAANAGCNIISEKPLALNQKKLLDVYSAVKNNNVKLTAMLTMRSEPEFVAAKNVYESGVIGEAVLVNGRKSYKWGNERPEWFGDKEKYGGTIGWVGIHAFDFINFITGLSFVKAAAMAGNFSHKERPACDDNCALILELSNGGHATVSVDFLRPDTAKTHGDDWVRIVGTKGVIEARTSDHSCNLISEETGIKQINLPEKQLIFRDFFKAVAGDESVVVFQEESFMLTRACLCCQESVDKKTFINIK